MMTDACEQDSKETICNEENCQDEHKETEYKIEDLPGTDIRTLHSSINTTSKRKRTAVVRSQSVDPKPLQARRPKKQKKDDEDVEVEFDTAWICEECKEPECSLQPNATTLLICDGACRRLFHYPCAGLEKLPAKDEKFVCYDCSRRTHTCSICSNYGIDDEDVFKCMKRNCGLFFHESCLSMQNVEVEIIINEDEMKSSGVETNDASNVVTRRLFVCPAHSCWTCTQVDLKEREDEEANALLPKTQSKTKGKGKRKAKGPSSFERKTGKVLTRCLECPIAYHVSCIPPSARFHELATLCHEHASTCKLPALDPEVSIQRIIEKKIDEKLGDFVKRQNRRSESSRNNPINIFFRGVSGEKATSKERILSEAILSNGFDEGFDFEHQFFCMPCNLRDEVHSKPPQYRHVHALQYDPIKKPPRIQHASGVCHCVERCDESCFNKMLYIECYGDPTVENGGKNYNCLLGPNCGNRQLGQRKAAKCKPIREQGKGWGLCTVQPVKKGDLIQEYVGEVIDVKTKEERLLQWSNEHPNDPNFYIMALQAGWFIDARNVANLSRFVNHSCDPNCRLTQVNVGGRIRCGIFAIRDLEAGTFLSYDYKFDTRHGDQFVCRCGSQACRGSMKAGMMQLDSGPKNKKVIWEEAKLAYERDKKFLSDFQADSEMRRTQVGALVPGSNSVDEFVANGPQEAKYRHNIQCNRIFLWRNTVQGSNFPKRFARLQRQQKSYA